MEPVKVTKVTQTNTRHFWPPNRLARFIRKVMENEKFFIKPTETYVLIAFLHYGWINFRLHGKVEYVEYKDPNNGLEFMNVDWIKDIYAKSLESGFIDEYQIELKIREEYDKMDETNSEG